MKVLNKYVAIKHHVDGEPTESHFELKTESLSLSVVPGSDDVAVKVLYTSIDPAQINRMKSCSSSQQQAVGASLTTGITPGQVISPTYGIGRIVASAHPKFEKGDLVAGFLAWGSYCTVRGAVALRKLDPLGFPLSYHVGVLGLSGFTAYTGFFEICKPKKGEKVFVSTASGSVGNLVGQFAKLLGCYVVGSAGSKEKVDLLKDKLGFDDAFNYKEESDLNSAIQRYFPEGIDIYFDNVGGKMLEAALANMNIKGRVAACGVISEYTNTLERAAPNMVDVVYKRIRIEGFISVDLMDMFPDFLRVTCDHLRSGKIQVLEDISAGLESIPSAFCELFRGDNVGKKMVRIGDE